MNADTFGQAVGGAMFFVVIGIIVIWFLIRMFKKRK
jgi:hypothetical protein